MTAEITVSTLLEILVYSDAWPMFSDLLAMAFQPFLRFWLPMDKKEIQQRIIVSTLLEILDR